MAKSSWRAWLPGNVIVISHIFLPIFLLLADSQAQDAQSGEVFGTLADFNLIDDGLYSGNTRRGLPHGDGLLVFFTTDGEKRYNYSGEWFNGRRQGHGILHFRDGTAYEGHFDKDRANGRGMISYANGDSFQGFFVQGLRAGSGTLRLRDGSRREGEWREGKLHGFIFFHPVSGGVEIERWENGRRKSDGATERQRNPIQSSPEPKQLTNNTIHEPAETNITPPQPGQFARGNSASSEIRATNPETPGLVSPGLVYRFLSRVDQKNESWPSIIESRREDRALLRAVYDWIHGQDPSEKSHVPLLPAEGTTNGS